MCEKRACDKFGPDFKFGPDVVRSEPISKVASGNHGGTGTPFRRWSSTDHSPGPNATLQTELCA